MKITIRVLFLFFIFSQIAFAQGEVKIFPSAYYTYGNYTDNSSSKSYSAYIPFTWNSFDYITLGYDHLNITNPDWKYRQHMLTAAATLNFYPVYLKLSYSYIKGGLGNNSGGYDYRDKLNLYSAKVLYNLDLFYFGLLFDYTNMNNGNTLEIKHFGASVLWIIDPVFSAEIKPIYTITSDNRDLLSVKMGLNYSPANPLLIKIFGFVGEQAFSYNEDLLTFFNQVETQKNLGVIRAEYDFIPEITLVGSLEYTEFENYIIRYYVAGLKFNITL